MLIKSFKAKSVYGYLDFNILFNKDVSFLVGGNGSGKTTALKLINALVQPNFKELLQIPFRECSLEVVADNIDIVISSRSDGNTVSLQVSEVEGVLELPVYSNSEFEYYPHKEEKIEEMIADIVRHNADHPVMKAISKLDTPIFLGLDRRREDVSSKQDYFHEREFWMVSNRVKKNGVRKLIKGSIGASLMDTEMLVQNSYRRIRELENKQSHRLRDKILMSSFQFSSFESDDFLRNIDKWKEQQGLLAKKEEIKDAILNIVGEESSLSSEVDKFFSEMTKLFQTLSKSKEGLAIEWLLNKAQIERMAGIVDIIDDHKSKIDSFYRPISKFLNAVNKFYKDSNKKLKVDAVGQLVIERPDGTECTIEGLSSGERQLLVIFAHAYFNRQSAKGNVFIVDEPELSLHLGWQEMFSEMIFSVNPKSQFILATHSPEIVAGNKNKSVYCR